MRKRITLILLVISSIAQAQFFEDYKNLKSQGSIPKDFLLRSTEKYEESIDSEISENDTRKTKKSKETFLLSSSFELKKMLFNGKILFSDTLSSYVNRVADQLLLNQPDLRQKLRFYLYNSSSANGFATNDGMIFITLGMISQLENEAQLAFILSHEVSHYTQKHVINSYVNNDELYSKNGKRLSREQLDLRKNQYSQELETEADLLGLNLFLKSSYSSESIERVFDILKYSYLPFDDIEFDKTLFQNEFYKFPQDYWLEEANPIQFDDDYDEDKSTHPSPDKRKKKISHALKNNTSSEDKQKYLVGDKDYFKFMRDVARFEVAKTFVREKQYKEAFYHSYLLSKKFKDNKYLNRMMSLALYYKFRDKLPSKFRYSYETVFDEGNSDQEAEISQIYQLFNSMTEEEAGVFALRFVELCKMRYPEEPIFKKISFDLMYLLSRDYELEIEDFAREFPIVNDIKIDTANKDISKLDKIEEQIKPYFKYAFVDILKQNSQFEDTFKKASVIASQSLKTANIEVDYDEKKKRLKQEKHYGKSFGINSLVIVDPGFTKIDNSKKQSLRFKASEQLLENLHTEMKQQAKNADLKLDIVSDVGIAETDIKQYNDMILLNNWISHSFKYLDKADTSFLVSIDEEKKNEMIERKNASHFCWSGFISSKEKQENVLGYCCGAIIIPMYSPYYIYKLITPEFSTDYYLLTFDLSNNKFVWSNYDTIDNKGSKVIIRSILYDTFSQLKSKRKK